MAKARKTRQVKATTTQKATQAKRKPLKNLDKNLANGKSNSQKPKKQQVQPSRRSTRQKKQEEKKVVYKESEESSIDESPVQSQSPLRESSPSDHSSISSLNSGGRDAAVEDKVSNKAAPTKTARLARPLDADFEQVRDWRSSSVIDY